ncbi:MAG: acyl-CoA dehydrogenase family protein [Deltaproteobacteria bacterium]|nr:acyl-CoA dehydrogenase family protein [Deltaproteobacteria bacterium]
MDLSYGTEMEGFRDEVKAFLKGNWPLTGDDAKLEGAERDVAFRQRAIDAGYLYRNIPKAYGGSEQEPDVLKAQVIREEFGKAWAPTEARGIGTMMLAPTLLDRGEPWQKEKFVPPTLRGELVWCQGYSEPGSGSDLASLKTKGVLDNGEWVINGQKIWTSGAKQADYMFCLVRTEPDAGKHAGISYLLIDMKQPGIDIRPLKQMNGTADFNEVFMTDVRTPENMIVGKRGEGWLVSRTTLKHERNSIGAAAQTRAQFKGLVSLAKKRTINGKPAIEDPTVRQRLAMIDGYVQAHVTSGYRQLTADAKGESPGLIQMMNKVNSCNIGHEVAKLSLDLLGDDGLMGTGSGGHLGAIPTEASAWISQYMWSLGIAVAGGTANIQRNVIGERGLGLPRDAAANRGTGK